MSKLFKKFSEFNELLLNWKKDKKKIVFTNGCFDILHRGHVEYLEKAKSYGDFLVVGLNSDESVKRLKGISRPYIAEEDRGYLLAGLKSVDAVVIFDEDTPHSLISNIIPDVLVKGGDYNIKDIVGRDVVESNGGKVITVNFIEGRSSSSIIKKIKNSN